MGSLEKYPKCLFQLDGFGLISSKFHPDQAFRGIVKVVSRAVIQKNQKLPGKWDADPEI